jgi:6-phosphogluconolactonase (cycloisomerase 2 family)
VVPIEKDGTLGARTDLANLPGEPGPDRKQQASSHPHNAVFDPSGRFIAVPDKGLDRVFVFRLDAASGKLTPNDPPFVATRAGAGPRHIAFHPQMPLAYVINELGSNVTTYRFDAQRGSLEPIQILPSTPASYTGNNTGAEIVFRPRRLCIEPRTRQHRDFCRRSTRRDPNAGGLGADQREVAPLFLPRSGSQNPLCG